MVEGTWWAEALCTYNVDKDTGLRSTPLRSLIIYMPEVAKLAMNKCVEEGEPEGGEWYYGKAKMDTVPENRKTYFNYQCIDDIDGALESVYYLTELEGKGYIYSFFVGIKLYLKRLFWYKSEKTKDGKLEVANAILSDEKSGFKIQYLITSYTEHESYG